MKISFPPISRKVRSFGLASKVVLYECGPCEHFAPTLQSLRPSQADVRFQAKGRVPHINPIVPWLRNIL